MFEFLQSLTLEGPHLAGVLIVTASLFSFVVLRISKRYFDAIEARQSSLEPEDVRDAIVTATRPLHNRIDALETEMGRLSNRSAEARASQTLEDQASGPQTPDVEASTAETNKETSTAETAPDTSKDRESSMLADDLPDAPDSDPSSPPQRRRTTS